jgi:C-terminal processing protease CtpA/Prc
VRPEEKGPAGRDHTPVSLRREGCTAVLRVRTLVLPRAFQDHDLPALIAEAHDACGLVIDLRDDAGGYDTAAQAIVTALSDRPIGGASFRVRLSPLVRRERPAWRGLPEDPARRGWSLPQPITAAAGPRQFAGPIVAIMDAGCRSSCETLALLLHARGALLVGARTGGSTGAPLTVPLPRSGARVTVPVWAVHDGAGQSIEGVGVAPDAPIDVTATDLRERTDPMLARALALAGTR